MLNVYVGHDVCEIVINTHVDNILLKPQTHILFTRQRAKQVRGV